MKKWYAIAAVVLAAVAAKAATVVAAVSGSGRCPFCTGRKTRVALRSSAGLFSIVGFPVARSLI